MGRLGQSSWTDFLRRTLATGCVALILALGLFAASPTLHERLHVDPQTTADDGCAVALFATGVSVPVPVLALPPGAGEWRELPPVVSPGVVLDSPRYLLQPERGSPVG